MSRKRKTPPSNCPHENRATGETLDRGRKMIPPCDPPPENVPPIFYSPKPVAKPIRIFNGAPVLSIPSLPVSVSCGENNLPPDTAAGGQGTISYAAAAQMLPLDLGAIPGLTQDQADWISRRENLLNEALSEAALIASAWKISIEQAEWVKNNVAALQASMKAVLEAASAAMLNCGWLSEEVTVECEPEGAVSNENYDKAVPSVTFPAGARFSKISRAAANIEAETAARALLRCLYANDEQTAYCGEGAVGPNAQAVVAAGAVIRATKEEANSAALAQAEASLDCYWLSAAATATCPEPGQKSGSGAERTASMTIPAGTFSSTISQADADAQAQAVLSNFLAGCNFCNERYTSEKCNAEVTSAPSCNGVPVLVENRTPDSDVITVAPGVFCAATQAEADAAAKAFADNATSCRICVTNSLPATCVGAINATQGFSGEACGNTSAEAAAKACLTSMLPEADTGRQDCLYGNPNLFFPCPTFLYNESTRTGAKLIGPPARVEGGIDVNKGWHVIPANSILSSNPAFVQSPPASVIEAYKRSWTCQYEACCDTTTWDYYLSVTTFYDVPKCGQDYKPNKCANISVEYTDLEKYGYKAINSAIGCLFSSGTNGDYQILRDDQNRPICFRHADGYVSGYCENGRPKSETGISWGAQMILAPGAVLSNIDKTDAMEKMLAMVSAEINCDFSDLIVPTIPENSAYDSCKCDLFVKPTADKRPLNPFDPGGKNYMPQTVYICPGVIGGTTVTGTGERFCRAGCRYEVKIVYDASTLAVQSASVQYLPPGAPWSENTPGRPGVPGIAYIKLAEIPEEDRLIVDMYASRKIAQRYKITVNNLASCDSSETPRKVCYTSGGCAEPVNLFCGGADLKLQKFTAIRGPLVGADDKNAGHIPGSIVNSGSSTSSSSEKTVVSLVRDSVVENNPAIKKSGFHINVFEYNGQTKAIVTSGALYQNLTPASAFPIDGIGEEFLINENTKIYLEITFSNSGAISNAKIKTDASFNIMAPAWSRSNSYCEDDGAAENPKHRTSRKLIAYTTPGSDGKPVLTQVMFHDQITTPVIIDGRPAQYPFAHEGGYPL